ncbi:septum site-determining protein MinC [Caryophanon tenue]|uniref:Probable septum site-determining protein MinC n=1 Tax=Caryophanon tenue TaxID=33978 RepID=A0A1C0YMQ6_9BACL|nr:septum site-determining protein MinC [Caryophanon tenue]OCS88444.1 septum site-determining protein MinC [Caryophanon tenue]
MKKALVHMKGTKDGLVLRLDDQCVFEDVVEELTEKVKEASEEPINVQLQLGYRYCTDEQKQQLMQIVHTHSDMRVSKVVSEVITVKESNDKLLENRSQIHMGVVRSGQVVQAAGDLFVVGDVNPNGKVAATGSIYVLGKLVGIAHAGVEGNEEAVIAASYFKPTQVRIADQLEIMFDENEKIAVQPHYGCAFIDEHGRIDFNRLQMLKHVRQSLEMAKGGL